jgi:hypothetical protein
VREKVKLATKAFKKKPEKGKEAGKGGGEEEEEEEEGSPGLLTVPGGALARSAPDNPT